MSHWWKVRVSLFRERLKRYVRRHTHWQALEKWHLEENPKCAACGGQVRLQVHHVIPPHEDESRDLDPKNLITLCMGANECHLRIGHGSAWMFYNRACYWHCLLLQHNPDLRETIEKIAKLSAR